MTPVSASAPYRGRFAPSPTGRLHFGSLVAAVGSYLEAKSHGGQWLVRMEDLDSARNQPGAAEGILRALEAFALVWDETVLYQSTRQDAYRAALAALRARGAAFACACTRREIADSAVGGLDGPVYPGTCRNGLPPGKAARAWRVRVASATVGVDDRIQGRIEHRLDTEVGDFVVLRADGVVAYQLAVVVDDAAQGVTDIVRGADLLDSTPRQVYLHGLLGLKTPSYAHLPVAVNGQGEKLSKQTFAPVVQTRDGMAPLVRALAFLGQDPPPDLARASAATFWQWAMTNWSLDKVPRRRALLA